jgi:hypothetical protein
MKELHFMRKKTNHQIKFVDESFEEVNSPARGRDSKIKT